MERFPLLRLVADLACKLNVGNHVYVVGGAVRNYLLHRPIKDMDLVIDSVAASKPAKYEDEIQRDSAWFAESLVRLFKSFDVELSLVTNNYGVQLITVVTDLVIDGISLKGEVVEIANARTESYSKGEYKPYSVRAATIAQDILRRDFTVNTLMWTMKDLNIHGMEHAPVLDLTGRGLPDLDKRVLNCVQTPERTFEDDASRMLRAVKFALRDGFALGPELREAIGNNAQLLTNIPSSHLSNMIINDFYATGLGREALMLMDELNLLKVVRDICKEQRPFYQALQHWVSANATTDFMLYLLDMEMPSGALLASLTDDELTRLRDLQSTMSASELHEFTQLLLTPGKLVNMKQLIDELGLRGEEIRPLSVVIRNILLSKPEHRVSGELLQAAVKTAFINYMERACIHET